jgi:hypothetical protein
VSSKSLAKEKFEYLRYILTRWADIFIGDRGLIIVHFSTRDVVKNFLEVFTTDFNKELQPFKSYENQILQFFQQFFGVYDQNSYSTLSNKTCICSINTRPKDTSEENQLKKLDAVYPRLRE